MSGIATLMPARELHREPVHRGRQQYGQSQLEYIHRGAEPGVADPPVADHGARLHAHSLRLRRRFRWGHDREPGQHQAERFVLIRRAAPLTSAAQGENRRPRWPPRGRGPATGGSARGSPPPLVDVPRFGLCRGRVEHVEMRSASPNADMVLAEIVRRLVTGFQPERIYLFGSRARGDAGPDSDYDLLMVLGQLPEPSYRVAQRAHSLLWGLGTAADILVWSRQAFDSRLHLRASLPSTVVREGVLLHGR